MNLAEQIVEKMDSFGRSSQIFSIKKLFVGSREVNGGPRGFDEDASSGDDDGVAVRQHHFYSAQGTRFHATTGSGEEYRSGRASNRAVMRDLITSKLILSLIKI